MACGGDDNAKGKSMRVYHFLSAKYGIEDIQRRRLKIARIGSLNDPFELLGVASDDPEIMVEYKSLKNGLAKPMGLLCFSENGQNPVQWSHYGDHHRGICLGFEISPTAGIMKVRYVDERLRPDLSAMKEEGSRADRHIKSVITTKFRHWQYEQEHRLFVDLKTKNEKAGFYWYDFSCDVRLCEVIIGVKSDVTSHEVVDALGMLESVVCVSKAKLDIKRFRVV
jgi:hypothetical protein